MKKNKKKKQKRRENSVPEPRKIKFDLLAPVLALIVGGLFTWSFVNRGLSPLMGLSLGLFIALAAVSYFEPRKWTFFPYVCAVLGAVFGGSFAISIEAGLGVILISTFIGVVLGLFATSWIQHISI